MDKWNRETGKRKAQRQRVRKRKGEKMEETDEDDMKGMKCG
jgi:hypothetical protein